MPLPAPTGRLKTKNKESAAPDARRNGRQTFRDRILHLTRHFHHLRYVQNEGWSPSEPLTTRGIAGVNDISKGMKRPNINVLRFAEQFSLEALSFRYDCRLATRFFSGCSAQYHLLSLQTGFMQNITVWQAEAHAKKLGADPKWDNASFKEFSYGHFCSFAIPEGKYSRRC